MPRALTWPLELFQFTPLREGLLNFALIEMSAIYFNSRPCERGFHNSWVGKWMTEFQFTPLREGLLNLRNAVFLEFHFNSRPCERGFSKKHQFFYPSFAVFYSLITFSQNQFFQFPSLISIDLIFVQFSLRRSPKFLCMGNICARFYNNKGSPASTFNFFPIESILF